MACASKLGSRGRDEAGPGCLAEGARSEGERAVQGEARSAASAAISASPSAVGAEGGQGERGERLACAGDRDAALSDAEVPGRRMTFRRIRTRSGHTGYVLGEARGHGGVPPTWRQRARLREGLARERPQDALREVRAHYQRIGGRAAELTLSTNSEEYGFETMLRIDAYGERFIGGVCRSERRAEADVCTFALHVYFERGYAVWT